MITTRVNLLLIIIIALLASSCISTKKVERSFSYYRPIINYYPDSEIKSDKRSTALNIEAVIIDKSVRQKTSVTKKSGWMIPLIVINIWKSKKICYQGLSSFYTPIEQSFKHYLKEESSRSGNYQLDSLDADYELEIILKKVEAYGPYKDVGSSFFLSTIDYTGTAGPAVAELEATYQLKKNGVLIRESPFESNRIVEFIDHDYDDRNDLLKTYAIRMAEATSQNIKTVIEAMVVDLNGYFRTVQ